METVGCSQGRLAPFVMVGSLLCGTRCLLEGRVLCSQQNKGDLAQNLPWLRAQDVSLVYDTVGSHANSSYAEFSSGSSMSCPAVKC